MSFFSGLVTVLVSDEAFKLEMQIGAAAITGMVGVSLRFAQQRLKLQAGSTAAQLEATANAAIQTATANFAAKVSGGLADGTLTQAAAVTQLVGYLHTSVADSMALLKPGLLQLGTILAGKLAALNTPPVKG